MRAHYRLNSLIVKNNNKYRQIYDVNNLQLTDEMCNNYELIMVFISFYNLNKNVSLLLIVYVFIGSII